MLTRKEVIEEAVAQIYDYLMQSKDILKVISKKKSKKNLKEAKRGRDVAKERNSRAPGILLHSKRSVIGR